MQKKEISVIITYHNEPQEIYEPLLNSINGQIKIDFNSIEVIVSSNCENPRPIDFSKYDNLKDKIKVLYPTIKNSLSASRQYALDNCTGTYCMFCDCDDIIASPVSFAVALNRIHKVEYTFDIATFDCVHEFHKILQNAWEIDNSNLIEVWGKLYNVQTIRNNNVRFDNRLRFNEDRDFNVQLINKICDPTILQINYPLYINICNEASTTNNTNQNIKVHDFVLFVYKALKDNSVAYCDTDLRLGLLCSAFETIYTLKDNQQDFSYYLTWMFELCKLYDNKLLFLTEEINRNKINSDNALIFKNMYMNYCQYKNKSVNFDNEFFDSEVLI